VTVESLNRENPDVQLAQLNKRWLGFEDLVRLDLAQLGRCGGATSLAPAEPALCRAPCEPL
jgi:hypothetical protein